MNTLIAGEAVRKFRKERGWTQEHLATVASLSTRTIQRAETTGVCSIETRSALASVFEIDAADLDQNISDTLQTGNAKPDALTAAPAVPVSPSSLFAYANAHPRPLGLIHALAERRRLGVKTIDAESAWLNEQVQTLGIKTIRELDGLVEEYASKASRLADYMNPKQPVDTGFILGRVLELVAIDRGGKEGLIKFCASLKYSSGGAKWAEEIFHAYEEIREHG